MLSFNACMYDYLLNLKVELATEFLLKNFDFSKTLLLGLEGIDDRILEILVSLAELSLTELLIALDFIVFMLNCETIYCLKDLLSLLAVNLSHPDSYMDERKSQAANPNSEI